MRFGIEARLVVAIGALRASQAFVVRPTPAISSVRRSSFGVLHSSLDRGWENDDFLSSLSGGNAAADSTSEQYKAQYRKQSERAEQANDLGETGAQDDTPGGSRWNEMMKQSRERDPRPPGGPILYNPLDGIQAPSSAPAGQDLEEASLEEQARRYREMMQKQQQQPPPVAQQTPSQPQRRPGSDGRKTGRNRDADAIANSADLYFAQLKRDSTVRTLARQHGDIENANKVFEDEGIKDLEDLLKTNPYLKESGNSLSGAAGTEEMIAVMKLTAERDENIGPVKAPSYKEKLVERRRKQPGGIPRTQPQAASIPMPVQNIGPARPMPQTASTPPFQQTQTASVAETAKPPGQQTPVRMPREGSVQQNRQTTPQTGTQQTQVMMPQTGSVEQNRQAMPQAGSVQHAEGTTPQAGSVQQNRLPMPHAGSVQLTRENMPQAGSVQQTPAAMPQAGSVQQTPAIIPRAGSPVATAKTDAIEESRSQIRTLMGLLLKHRGGPGFGKGILKAPEAERFETLLKEVTEILRAEALMAGANLKSVMGAPALQQHNVATPTPLATRSSSNVGTTTFTTPGAVEAAMNSTLACVEGAVQMYKKSPPEARESLLVALRGALMSAVNTCNQLIAENEVENVQAYRQAVSQQEPAESKPVAPQQYFNLAPFSPASGTKLEATTQSQSHFGGAPSTPAQEVVTPQPQQVASNVEIPAFDYNEENSVFLKGVYETLVAASGEERFGLGKLNPAQAASLADEVAEMKAVLLEELDSGIPES